MDATNLSSIIIHRYLQSTFTYNIYNFHGYVPRTRKLCTPQNECMPMDCTFASFICNICNFVNGIKIGLIVNGAFESVIVRSSTFWSRVFAGIVRRFSGKERQKRKGKIVFRYINRYFQFRKWQNLLHKICKRPFKSVLHAQSSGHNAMLQENCKADNTRYHFIIILRKLI